MYSETLCERSPLGFQTSANRSMSFRHPGSVCGEIRRWKVEHVPEVGDYCQYGKFQRCKISVFHVTAAILFFVFGTDSNVKTGVGFGYKFSAAILFRRSESVPNIAEINACR